MTDSGQVYAWGDNDHGQQGNGTTTVNRKPALVHGLEGHRVSRVACGSSHSVCWTCQDSPSASCHEPVLFTESKDALGAGFVTNNVNNDSNNSNSNVNTTTPSVIPQSSTLPLYHPRKSQRPSLARIILSLESNVAKQQALQHILNTLQILYAREAVVSALTPHGGQPTMNTIKEPTKVPLASPDEQSDIEIIGGGEAPACPQDLSLEQSSPDSEDFSSSRGYTKLSSLPHGVSASSVMVGGAMISPLSEVSSVESFKNNSKDLSNVYVDDYTKLLCADDARMLVDLLKLAVTGRCSDRSRESLSTVLSALGATNALVGDMLLELCVTELEDVATDTERLKSVPHPVTQESSHPYTDDAMLTGHVRIPGAESLRVEFDRQCSTERRHDPLTIMDGNLNFSPYI